MSEHEVWNELGNLYFLSGAYREAVDAYQRSIQLDEDFDRPYGSLAMTYVKQGEYEKAVDLYKKSLALACNDEEKIATWNQLGHIYVVLKDYEEAMLAYQIADELEGKIQESFHDNGNAIPFDNSPTETSTFNLTDKSETTNFQGRRDHQEEVTQAESDEGESFPSEAVTVSVPTVNDEEYQQDISSVSETALMETETWTEANPDWEMELLPALDQDAEVYFPAPDDESLREWLPIPSLEALGQSSYQDQLQDDPDQDAEYVDEDQESTRVADEAPMVTGRKYEFNERFSLRVELNMNEKPGPAFKPAQRLTGQRSAAQIEYDRKNFDDKTFENKDEEINEIQNEISKFKRVVQINPRNSTAWDTLGTLYKSAGMFKDAILAYQQAISADPAKGFYHHHLALVFAAEGRNEDAIMAYQKVIEIDPDHSLANAALGGYYRKMGLEELAQKHIGKAMKNIYNSESEYNQACLEAICGNSDEAIQLLRIALEEKQTYVNWVMHDPDLDAIREHPSFKQLISDFIK